ncbi:hypothetical protein B0H11DRAFT_1940032 [Mycena galericulata]|nr:hypothetical protein B0H11DRAFT_1940032 [Mycena galericulata]
MSSETMEWEQIFDLDSEEVPPSHVGALSVAVEQFITKLTGLDSPPPDDNNSLEAQLRAADNRDFPMHEIKQGHEARLRADAPYRIPAQLLATSGAATPAQVCEDSPDLEMSSRPPTPVLPWTAPPQSYSRAPTPTFDTLDPASLLLFFPESREPTPFAYEGGLSDLSQEGTPTESSTQDVPPFRTSLGHLRVLPGIARNVPTPPVPPEPQAISRAGALCHLVRFLPPFHAGFPSAIPPLPDTPDMFSGLRSGPDLRPSEPSHGLDHIISSGSFLQWPSVRTLHHLPSSHVISVAAPPVPIGPPVPPVPLALWMFPTVVHVSVVKRSSGSRLKPFPAESLPLHLVPLRLPSGHPPSLPHCHRSAPVPTPSFRTASGHSGPVRDVYRFRKVCYIVLGSNRACPLPPAFLRLLPASAESLCTPSGTCPAPSGVTWLPSESSIPISPPSSLSSIVRQFAHPSELWCCENSRQENLRSSSGCSGLASTSGDPGELAHNPWRIIGVVSASNSGRDSQGDDQGTDNDEGMDTETETDCVPDSAAPPQAPLNRPLNLVVGGDTRGKQLEQAFPLTPLPVLASIPDEFHETSTAPELDDFDSDSSASNSDQDSQGDGHGTDNDEGTDTETETGHAVAPPPPPQIAQDADIEEDEPETVDDNDFIDDADDDDRPRHLLQPPSNFRLATDDGDEDDAEKIAAAIKKRYAHERDPIHDTPPPPHNEKSWHKHQLQATDADPLMYRVKILEGSPEEFTQRLMHDLQDPVLYPDVATRIQSVVYHESYGKYVYVETTGHDSLSHVLHGRTVGQLPERPAIIDEFIPLADRHSIFRLPQDTGELSGGWACVVKNGLYYGNLVYITPDTEEVLAVPRLLPPNMRGKKTSQRLFNPSEFPGKYQKQNMVYKLGEEEYKHGLLLSTCNPQLFTQRNVIPTSAELELFDRSSAPDLQHAHPPTVTSMALMPSDRVATRDDCRAGWIKSIRTHQSERLALVGSVLESLRMITAPDFELPVSQLGHHILSPLRRLEVHDRIIVVEGAYIGTVARVFCVNEAAGTVTFIDPDVPENPQDSNLDDAPNNNLIEVYINNVALCFWIGDTVAVTEGKFGGRSGFVTAVNNVALCFWIGDTVAVTEGKFGGRSGFVTAVNNGVAEIWDPTKVLVSVLDTYMPQEVEYEVSGMLRYRARDDVRHEDTIESESSRFRSFEISTKLLRFLKTGYHHIPTTSLAPSQLEDERVHEYTQLKQRDRRALDRMTELMRTGTDFKGREVVVVGKHHFKGRRGTVTGWRPDPKQKHAITMNPIEAVKAFQNSKSATAYGFEKAQFSVQFEGTSTFANIRSEFLADPESRHVFVPTTLIQWHGPYRNQTPSPPPPPRSPSPVEVLSDAERRERTSREAERTGTWLNALAGKRVDIVVDMSLPVPGEYMKKLGKKCTEKHGHDGFVVVQRSDKRGFKQTALLQRERWSLQFPPMCLRLQRTMFQDKVNLTRECISTVVVRVVIIGPDIWDETRKLGCCAQTIPNAQQTHGPGVVTVEFEPLVKGGHKPTGHFPLLSLCRSIKEDESKTTEKLTSIVVPWVRGPMPPPA